MVRLACRFVFWLIAILALLFAQSVAEQSYLPIARYLTFTKAVLEEPFLFGALSYALQYPEKLQPESSSKANALAERISESFKTKVDWRSDWFGLIGEKYRFACKKNGPDFHFDLEIRHAKGEITRYRFGNLSSREMQAEKCKRDTNAPRQLPINWQLRSPF